MSIPLEVLVVLVATALLAALCLYALIAATRWARARARAREAAAVSEMRPLVAACLAGASDAESVLDGRDAQKVAAVRTIAGGLLASLRGSDADRMAELFRAAGRALGGGGGAGRRPDAVEALAISEGFDVGISPEELLGHDDAEVRALAAYGLAARGGASAALAASAVIAAVGGERPIPGAVAADILCRVGPAALGPVREALDGPHPARRTVAAAVLGQVRDTASVGPLARSAMDESEDLEVRIRSVYALGRIGSPAGIAAIRACLVGPPELVAVAAQARAAAGGPGTTADLEPLLDSQSHEVVHAAAVGIALLGEEPRPGSGTGTPEAAAHMAWGRWLAGRPPTPQSAVLPLPGFSAMSRLVELAESGGLPQEPSGPGADEVGRRGV